jgi:hypothetical protein
MLGAILIVLGTILYYIFFDFIDGTTLNILMGLVVVLFIYASIDLDRFGL